MKYIDPQRKSPYTFLAFELFVVQLPILKYVNLSQAQSSPLPVNDFENQIFSGYFFIFWFNVCFSLFFFGLTIKKLGHNNSTSISFSFILLFSYILTIGSVLASIFHYWPRGVSVSLIFSSLAGQFLILQNIKISLSQRIKGIRLNLKKKTLSFWILLTVVFTTALFTIPIRAYFFWDYVGQEGRFAMQNSLIFSPFPIHSFSLRGETLKYHIGFDSVIASFSSLGNVPLDKTNVYLSLIFFFLTYFTLFRFIKTIYSELSIVTCVVLASLGLLSGGLPYYRGTSDSFGILASAFPNVDWKGLWLLPPFTSYFFQRSFALGLPILLCFLCLLHQYTNLQSYFRISTTDRFKIRNFSSFLNVIILTILLGGLASTSTTLSVTSIGILATILLYVTIWTVAKGFPNAKKATTYLHKVKPILMILVIDTILLFTINGFLRNNRVSSQVGVTNGFHFGYCGHTSSCFSYLIWFIGSFGISFLVLVLAILFWIVKREKGNAWSMHELLFLLLLPGLLIGFCLKFQGSPDVVKFGVFPRILMTILSFQIVTNTLINIKGKNKFKSKSGMHLSGGGRGRVIVGVLTLFLTSSGIGFAFPLVDQAPLKSKIFFGSFDSDNRKLSDETKIVELAKRLSGNNSFVCSPTMVNYCGTYGGLQQYQIDIISKQLGVDFSRRSLSDIYALSRYRQEGFYFFIVHSSDFTWWNQIQVWKSAGQIGILAATKSTVLAQISSQ